jgi:hypothetical protein
MALDKSPWPAEPASPRPELPQNATLAVNAAEKVLGRSVLSAHLFITRHPVFLSKHFEVEFIQAI